MKMSIEFLEKTALLKIKESFKYDEPSDLNKIKLSRPEDPLTLSSEIKKEELYNKIYGAWLGRSAGCLLGQPVEGWSRDKIRGLLKDTDNYPINRYISSDITQDIIDRYEILPGGMPKKSGLMKNWINNVSCMPEEDDMNYTVLGMKLLMEKGKDFASEDVGFEWLISRPIVHLSTAERVAYKNMVNNIYPPPIQPGILIFIGNGLEHRLEQIYLVISIQGARKWLPKWYGGMCLFHMLKMEFTVKCL